MSDGAVAGIDDEVVADDESGKDYIVRLPEDLAAWSYEEAVRRGLDWPAFVQSLIERERFFATSMIRISDLRALVDQLARTPEIP